MDCASKPAEFPLWTGPWAGGGGSDPGWWSVILFSSYLGASRPISFPGAVQISEVSSATIPCSQHDPANEPQQTSKYTTQAGTNQPMQKL